MKLKERINAFIKLGRFLSQFSVDSDLKKEDIEFNDLFFDGFKHQIKLAGEHNGWFTENNILFALNGWSDLLNEKSIHAWLENYNLSDNTNKTVAIIMAGNIPLVGFHDFLSVLMSGHNVLVKQSSNDKHLLPFLAKYLEYVEPGFKDKIKFTEAKLDRFDAVIATGSTNTSRYFEYYFKNKPSIIRKNRNSVAVLHGNESEAQLKALSNDIFRYFGLGCRNVSKIYVPSAYKFDLFFKSIYDWKHVIDDQKYANNYDYNKAVYIMSEFDILENGFLMIKEDKGFSSPIATLFYEYYESADELKEILKQNHENIQCIVADNFLSTEIKFGETQHPALTDYADGIDTVDFLLTI